MLELRRTNEPHETFGGQELDNVPKLQLLQDGEPIGSVPWEGTDEEAESLQTKIQKEVEGAGEEEVVEEVLRGFHVATIFGFDLSIDAQAAAQMMERESRSLP